MTTQTNHTPSPWHLRRYSDLLRVDNGKGNSENVSIVEYYDQDARDPEMLANARLIAAAPDMLAALKLAIHKLEILIPAATGGCPAAGDIDYEQITAVFGKATYPFDNLEE